MRSAGAASSRGLLGAMRAVRRLASALRLLFRCASLRRFASRVGLRRLASACLRPDFATIYLNVVRYRGRASDNSGQRSFLQLWAGVFLLGSEALLLRMTRWGVRRRLRLAAFPARPDPPVRGCCPRWFRPAPHAGCGCLVICLCPARSNLCESAKAVRTGRLPCLCRLVHRLSRRKRNVRNFSGEARQGVAREVSTWSGRWR